MKLSELLTSAGLPRAGADDADVSAFAIDSRKVTQGTVFGAFHGAQVNGEDFIPAAITAGACAIVARPEAHVENAIHIKCEEPRRAFAQLAAQFYRPMPGVIAAVTGTNGKTSCAEMTRQLWHMSGARAASIGTLGVTTADGSVSTGLTTPDIVTFLANLAGLSREGVSHVVFEASSHGLAQYRSEGVRISAAAFTNLSRDHLDYHGDMESYFDAKMRLFDEVAADDAVAVIWDSGDEWSARAIARAGARGLRVLSVGEGEACQLRLCQRTPTQLGQNLRVQYEGVTMDIVLPLIGAYQAANALLSAALAGVLDGDLGGNLARLSRLQPVAGRLQRAAITGAGVPIYVDYAHTPDALIAALEALRPHTRGRLLCVFGAGGDRDKGKRGPMGAAVSKYADMAIVTDDNPRGEDPAHIRAEIMASCALGTREIADRAEAIKLAISEAHADDIVLIAGKGHEKGQIYGAGADQRIIAFDDVAIAAQFAHQLVQG